jgi:hypothetical protein
MQDKAPQLVTDQLVVQRVRNRIIEVLEWILGGESTPPEGGVNTPLNFWYDFMPPVPPDDLQLELVQDYFSPPVFTPDEAKLVFEVSAAINAFYDATPNPIRDDAAAIALPQWAKVISMAKSALSIMLKRGRMSEEEEECL